MTTVEDLLASERALQNWFHASFDAHSHNGSTAEDFRHVGTPFIQSRFIGYNYLYKRTVRTPAAYITNHDAFASALTNFLIENIIGMYGRSVRIAMTESKEIVAFKDCGEEIGAFQCFIRREGNIFILEAVYQVYRGCFSVLTHPNELLHCTEANICQCHTFRLLEEVDKVKWKRSMWRDFWIILTLLWVGVPFIEKSLLPPPSPGYQMIGQVTPFLCCNPCFFLWFALCLYNHFTDPSTNNRLSWLSYEIERHARMDLSPLHMQVAYESQDEVAKAIAKNFDHQIFIDRIGSAIERAVSAGEQAN